MKTLVKIPVRYNGFTLVEVLVALLITGLIMGGISTAIIQLFSVSNQNTNSITAQRQVQQAGTSISNDALQARVITVGKDNTPAGTGFKILMVWTNLNGDEYAITYRLENGTIFRDQVINNNIGAATVKVVAENISMASGDTKFRLISVGAYELKVTSTITGKINVSETRFYEIKMRAS